MRKTTSKPMKLTRQQIFYFTMATKISNQMGKATSKPMRLTRQQLWINYYGREQGANENTFKSWDQKCILDFKLCLSSVEFNFHWALSPSIRGLRQRDPFVSFSLYIELWGFFMQMPYIYIWSMVSTRS